MSKNERKNMLVIIGAAISGLKPFMLVIISVKNVQIMLEERCIHAKKV